MMPKIKIIRANTVHAAVTIHPQHKSATAFFRLEREERCRLFDYIQELRQQAKWDAEKCANQ